MLKPSRLISKVTIYLISFLAMLVSSGCTEEDVKIAYDNFFCDSALSEARCYSDIPQTHFDNSDASRFDSSAYTADYSNPTNLQGIWLVFTQNGDARERYNCQLTLKEGTTNQYNNDCEIFTEFSAPLTYTSSNSTLATQRTIAYEGHDMGDGEIYGAVYHYNFYVNATLTDTSHLTGSIYRDEYTSDGRALVPKTITFEMVRIDTQYQVLGNIKLRNFVDAFNDEEAPYTEIYPITRFYEYSAKPAATSAVIWTFRFYNNENRIFYASGRNSLNMYNPDNLFYGGPSGDFEISIGTDNIAKPYTTYNQGTVKTTRYDYIQASYYYGRFDRLINNTEQMQINFDYIQTGATNFAETKVGIIDLSL